MSERDIKVQAIINPISGVGSKRKIPKMIEGICSKKNCSLNISFTEYAGHASELTRQAIEEGAEYILAVGGDGTVNEIESYDPFECDLRYHPERFGQWLS